MGRAVKILAIADLHGRTEMLDRLDTDVDLITVSGDLHNLESEPEARETIEALAGLGPKVLIVPGNMDPKQLSLRLWEEAGLEVIDRRAFRLRVHEMDIGFVGFGGIVARGFRKPGDPSRFYHREEEVFPELEAAYKGIAGCDVKVLVTHQPPQGCLDRSFDGEVTGSLGLRRFAEEFGPDLLLCGHIHEARGEARIGGTLVLNVGELRKGHYATFEIFKEDDIKGYIDGINISFLLKS